MFVRIYLIGAVPVGAVPGAYLEVPTGEEGITSIAFPRGLKPQAATIASPHALRLTWNGQLGGEWRNAA